MTIINENFENYISRLKIEKKLYLKTLESINYQELENQRKILLDLPLLDSANVFNSQADSDWVDLWWLADPKDKVTKIRLHQKSRNKEQCFKTSNREKCSEYDCYWRGLCLKDLASKINLLNQIKKRVANLTLTIGREQNLVSLFFDSQAKSCDFYQDTQSSLKEFIIYLCERLVGDVERQIPFNDLKDDLFKIGLGKRFHEKKPTKAQFSDWLIKINPANRKKVCESVGFYKFQDEFFSNNNKFHHQVLPLILRKIDFNHDPVTNLIYDNATETTMANFNRADFQNLLNSGKINFEAGKNFDVPSKIFIYENLAVYELEGYKISLDTPAENNMAYLLNDNDCCGYFTLIEEKNDLDKPTGYYFLTALAADLVNPNKVNNSTSNIFYLACKPQNGKWLKTKVDLKFESPKETSAELCIDFGTSNTSAGAFLFDGYADYIEEDHPIVLNESVTLERLNFVRFKKGASWQETLPTIIYTQTIKNDQPNYLFGYEAQAKVKEKNFCPQGSVLSNFKKWLTNLEETEDLSDESGKKLDNVKHELILRAYLDHIIHSAQSQFKCLFKKIHFSAPVKLKEHYVNSFKKILHEYSVFDGKESLDEGVTVLYDVISQKMKELKEGESGHEKALIIDCGGGTTDLASCEFNYADNGDSFKLSVKVDREDGDNDFGGNQLTERILQYLQIRLAKTYNDSLETGVDKLINISGDLYRQIDREHGKVKIYENLEKTCCEAEKHMPVNYNDYRNSLDQLTKVRNNYLFLWEQAEEIKKAFFKSNEVVEINLVESDDDSYGNGRVINIPFKKMEINFLKDEKWHSETVRINEPFTNREIERLITADVYEVLRKLLTPLEADLDNYKIIKLSGQSCRIDLFRQSLKEFIPGRKINQIHKESDESSTRDLKLSCLRGALNYLKDKREGKILTTLEYFKPGTPCDVFVFDHRDKQKMMIGENVKLTEGINTHEILEGGTDLKIIFSKGQIQKRERFVAGEWQEKSIAEILKIDKRISQKEHLDTLVSGKMKFIMFSCPDIYGLKVLAVKKTADGAAKPYLCTSCAEFRFENTL